MLGWILLLAASVAAGVAFRGRGERFLREHVEPRIVPRPPRSPSPRHAAQAPAAAPAPRAPSSSNAVSPAEFDAAKRRLADATEAVAMFTMMKLPADDPRYVAAIAEQAAARANLDQLIEASKLGQPMPAPTQGGATPMRTSYGPSNVSYPIDENDPAITRWLDPVTGSMLAARVPVSFAMAWLAIESSGKPCAIGVPGAKGPDGNPLELGLWQAYNPDDLKPAGITGAELRAYCVPGGQALARAMTPGEIARQMDLGVSLITRKRAYADRYLTANGVTWPTTGPDYWAAVKLPHAWPPIINTGLHQVVQKLRRAPISWAEFRATYEQIEPRAKFDPNVKEQSLYYRGLQNAEWCGWHVLPPGVG